MNLLITTILSLSVFKTNITDWEMFNDNVAAISIDARTEPRTSPMVIIRDKGYYRLEIGSDDFTALFNQKDLELHFQLVARKELLPKIDKWIPGGDY